MNALGGHELHAESVKSQRGDDRNPNRIAASLLNWHRPQINNLRYQLYFGRAVAFLKGVRDILLKTSP